MPQYVFVHKTTRGGYHYFIVYLAAGNRPVAVSRFAYVNENAALNDVIEQIREGEKFLKTSPVSSSAAGGAR